MMASWQAEFVKLIVRLHIRRRKWGSDEAALARRARRVFGAPGFYQRLQSYAVNVAPIRDGNVDGEWVTPKDVDEDGVILYLHGGGYISCSAATHRPITAALARLSRLRIFAANYRLAPEFRFPAAVDDAMAAYQWLIEQKRSTIALAGDSAGGGLVLALMLRARDVGLPSPVCGVCFSAWTDLAGTGESIRANDGRDAMFRTDNMPDFAAAYLGEQSASNPLASPFYANLKGLPPVQLQVASPELLLDDSRRVHEKIQQSGGVSRLEIYDDLFHGWQMTDRIVPEARDSLRSAAKFIREFLQRSTISIPLCQTPPDRFK
ncbi:MAG TPA: alpha/beta hydrolase [Verrucomicrobiae bacterium]|nr:alpha/beta hydrolase [Verrucomicrobiae bacterium]